MRMTIRGAVLACSLAALLAGPAGAAMIRDIEFPEGLAATLVNSTLSGADTAEYGLAASRGQQLAISMSSDNPAAYFRVYAPGVAPGAGAALFDSQTQGAVANLTLPESGKYTLQTYLTGPAAQQGQRAAMRLELRLSGQADPGSQTPEGLTRGPESFTVTGVATSLNIRSQPSTSAGTAGVAPRGDVLTNRGCREAEGRTWCQVTTSAGVQGWAAQEFLTAGSAAAPAAVPTTPAAAPAAPATGGGNSPSTGDLLQVTGTSLNLRGSPSASTGVVTVLTRGTVVRNLGCTWAENRNWCQVETANGQTGWAAQDFLTRAAAGATVGAPTAAAATTTPAPAAQAPVMMQVSASSVNLRNAATTTSGIVATLPRGTSVRRLGCANAEGRNWCQVETSTGQTGWAAQEFLTTDSVSAAPAAATPAAASTAGTTGASGSLPCSASASMLTQSCNYTVERSGSGNASVTVAWPGGGERRILFRAGRPAQELGADTTMRGDIMVITMGNERYEVPSAVVFGN
ncbi:MAG: SH3 domain-containing protein [Paracoccus sp. (in: a-proteobacteria)]|uniref:SH3 domain-containing protein n=1 Tax=Paracoccus sp. TaxID=267 RepID=UPI0026E01051|nr:SH3 domain-containing protein [Paracoccus sp. (in: a-proteobacteria)]MDO5622866.1 SH3 domain-containing protein [Paracoccus sp. (in: a-proteobacteria)]